MLHAVSLSSDEEGGSDSEPEPPPDPAEHVAISASKWRMWYVEEEDVLVLLALPELECGVAPQKPSGADDKRAGAMLRGLLAGRPALARWLGSRRFRWA